MKNSLLAVALVCAAGAVLNASLETFVPIAQRAKGSETIVVGKVIEVTPTFDTNEFGDRLIISHAFLQVEETLTVAESLPLGTNPIKGTYGIQASAVEGSLNGSAATTFVVQ